MLEDLIDGKSHLKFSKFSEWKNCSDNIHIACITYQEARIILQVQPKTQKSALPAFIQNHNDHII